MKARMLCVAMIGAAVFASGASAGTPFYAFKETGTDVTMVLSGFSAAQNQKLRGSKQRVYSNAGTMRCAFSVIDHPLMLVAVFSHLALTGRAYCSVFAANTVGTLTQVR